MTHIGLSKRDTVPAGVAVQDGVLAASLPGTQDVGVHHLWLGDTVVTALSDGWADASLDMIADPDKGKLQAMEHTAFRPPVPRLQIQAWLVRSPGQRPLLIDTGYGTLGAPTLGQLQPALSAAGVHLDEIGTVAMTHLHIDHVGGLADGSGNAAFAQAELVLASAEHNFWLDETNKAAAPETMRDGFALAARVSTPYRKRLRLVDAGEVAPGVTLVPLPGHTPGHSGFRIEGGGKTLLLVADIVHFPGIQFADPDVCVVFDTDMDEARATRRHVLDQAVAERLMIGGNHLDFPGVGHVIREAAGYRFVPLQWQYAP